MVRDTKKRKLQKAKAAHMRAKKKSKPPSAFASTRADV
jgi:hypothetical protein